MKNKFLWHIYFGYILLKYAVTNNWFKKTYSMSTKSLWQLFFIFFVATFKSLWKQKMCGQKSVNCDPTQNFMKLNFLTSIFWKNKVTTWQNDKMYSGQPKKPSRRQKCSLPPTYSYHASRQENLFFPNFSYLQSPSSQYHSLIH